MEYPVPVTIPRGLKTREVVAMLLGKIGYEFDRWNKLQLRPGGNGDIVRIERADSRTHAFVCETANRTARALKELGLLLDDGQVVPEGCKKIAEPAE